MQKEKRKMTYAEWMEERRYFNAGQPELVRMARAGDEQAKAELARREHRKLERLLAQS